MSIAYAAIVYNENILCQYTLSRGNYDFILLEFLKEHAIPDQRLSIKSTKQFYIIRTIENIFFALICEDENEKAFSILEEIKCSFFIICNAFWKTAKPFELQQAFGPRLENIILAKNDADNDDYDIPDLKELENSIISVRSSAIESQELPIMDNRKVIRNFNIYFFWDHYKWTIISMSIVVLAAIFLVIFLSE